MVTHTVRGISDAENRALHVLAARAGTSINKLLLACIRDMLRREGGTPESEEFAPGTRKLLKKLDP